MLRIEREKGNGGETEGGRKRERKREGWTEVEWNTKYSAALTSQSGRMKPIKFPLPPTCL